MQPYYAIKLKCFLFEICAASALLIISACVFVSVLQEYLHGYRETARLAYPAAFVICGFLFLCGLFLFYEAFHFERQLFGRKNDGFEILKQDMENGQAVFSEDLIVTPHFVMMFHRRFPKMCSLIRFEEIIACFETPVYGTVEDPSEYRLTVWDRKFNEHVIVMKASDMETGHHAKILICDQLRWIYQDDMDLFSDLKMTRKGRKKILDKVDRHLEDRTEHQTEAKITKTEDEKQPEVKNSQSSGDSLGIRDMIRGIGSRKKRKQ